MGRSKEMPLAVAEHLARVVVPYIEAVGTQVEASRQWGISQSHISQIKLGAGCGIAVLLTLREKLGLSLEELCFPPGKRKESPLPAGPVRPVLDLDAIRDVVRSELEARSEPPTASEPTEPPGPMPPKKGHSDAPRTRRR